VTARHSENVRIGWQERCGAEAEALEPCSFSGADIVFIIDIRSQQLLLQAGLAA
jgi:hypothetical protein